MIEDRENLIDLSNAEIEVTNKVRSYPIGKKIDNIVYFHPDIISISKREEGKIDIVSVTSEETILNSFDIPTLKGKSLLKWDNDSFLALGRDGEETCLWYLSVSFPFRKVKIVNIMEAMQYPINCEMFKIRSTTDDLVLVWYIGSIETTSAVFVVSVNDRKIVNTVGENTLKDLLISSSDQSAPIIASYKHYDSFYYLSIGGSEVDSRKGTLFLNLFNFKSQVVKKYRLDRKDKNIIFGISLNRDGEEVVSLGFIENGENNRMSLVGIHFNTEYPENKSEKIVLDYGGGEEVDSGSPEEEERNSKLAKSLFYFGCHNVLNKTIGGCLKTSVFSHKLPHENKTYYLLQILDESSLLVLGHDDYFGQDCPGFEVMKVSNIDLSRFSRVLHMKDIQLDKDVMERVEYLRDEEENKSLLLDRKYFSKICIVSNCIVIGTLKSFLML